MTFIMQVLRNYARVFVAYALSLAVTLAVFYFGNLDMGLFSVIAEVLLFCALVHLGVTAVLCRREQLLEEKLNVLEEELSLAKQQNLQAQNALEEYFLLWVHQIKTPISAVQVLSRNAQMSCAQSADFENSSIYKTITENLIYIDNYTNNALNFVKLSRQYKDMNFESVQLGQILSPIIKRYSMLFIDNDIKLEYEVGDNKVVTDPTYLSVLVEQFIFNAVKYAKGKSVRISFDSCENALLISDTGIGIKAEDLPRIFDRGYSGLNGKLQQRSTGIGLYIAQKIADKLGIGLKVESIYTQGSTFKIIFPTGKSLEELGV